jgi:hypothetical protein
MKAILAILARVARVGAGAGCGSGVDEENDSQDEDCEEWFEHGVTSNEVIVVAPARAVNLEEMPCAVRNTGDTKASFRHLLEPHTRGIRPRDNSRAVRQQDHHRPSQHTRSTDLCVAQPYPRLLGGVQRLLPICYDDWIEIADPPLSCRWQWISLCRPRAVETALVGMWQ